MGGGAADEPLPSEILDAVAAAIEDGASMDEIVERVRSRGGESSPSIPRARRCARAIDPPRVAGPSAWTA